MFIQLSEFDGSRVEITTDIECNVLFTCTARCLLDRENLISIECHKHEYDDTCNMGNGRPGTPNIIFL